MKLFGSSHLKVHQECAMLQYVAAFAANLNIIASGMHYAWPSPSLPKLLAEDSLIPITQDEGSWLAVMPLIGAVVGSLMVGSTIDILGRKRTIVFASVPFFLAWIMIAFAKSSVLISVARCLAGVADGWAFTAVPMFIGEIANPKIRGLLGSSVSVSWIFGTLLINIIGSCCSITVTALISSTIPVLCFVIFIWMPESPYYWLMRGKFNSAEKSLKSFRGLPDVTEDLKRIDEAIKAQIKNNGKFWDLFTVKSNRKAVYIIAILRAGQQLSGTTAITFYSQQIFMQAGDSISSELSSIIYFSVQLLMTMFCSSIVDITGRRPLLLISITGSVVALLVEGTYFYLQSNTDIDLTNFSYIPVIALVGFVILFSLGMQSIPILMLGELFPANVKAFALCLADIYFCVIATIVSKFFQIMKDSLGMYVPFYAFSASCLLAILCIYFVVPETKGKTLEEIQEYLRKDEKLVVDEEEAK